MATIETMPSEAAIGRSPGSSFLTTVLKALRAHYWARRELRRTRLHLFELSDSELKDIGLTREAADREASRSLLACYLNNSR